ncbi:MAG: ATP-binding protein, partial [Leptospirales bacterium]
MINKAHFSTKARVVDLLGREQIADAPTAITELLKNAIDAAAENVEVRYNTKTRCLEIEDDGLGMRFDDLKSKWMVLATDSKHGQAEGSYNEEWAKYATSEQKEKLRKKPLGEKGIGRLAVAALGNGTLVWTRWGKGKDIQRSLLLVHWHFFRHSAFLLDEIKFPIAEVKKNEDPKQIATQLCKDFAEWFKEKQDDWTTIDQLTLAAEIKNDLEKIFPKAIEEVEFKNDMGTLFGVLKTASGVEEIYEIDKDVSANVEKIPSEGLRTFFGFSNPFLEKEARLKVSAKKDDKIIYGSGSDFEFWVPDDFKECDHKIDIEINGNGFAKGIITKSKSKIIKYERSFSHLLDKGAKPGSFKIILGYVPGTFPASVLTKPNFDRFTKRLREYGGLYVYRDGIRVMPYGRFDNDFLSFDERRARHAGRHYFAYRRMFGAILLTSDNNHRLQDKAGREGFIKNNDYRAFQKILIDLFIDLAKSHFVEKPQEEKKDTKSNAGAAHRTRVDQEKKDFFEKFNQAKQILEKENNKIDKKIKDYIRKIDSYEVKVIQDIREFEDIETGYYDLSNHFNETLDQLITEEPKSFTLEERYVLTWDDYLNKRNAFEVNIQKKINKLAKRIEKVNAEFKEEKERIIKIE